MRSVGKLELSDGDGEAALEADSSQAEDNPEFVSRIYNESTETIANSHSEKAQDQVIKENIREQLTIYSNSTVAIGEKIDEIEYQYNLETIKESVPQLDNHTNELTVPSIEIEMQEVEQEVKVEASPDIEPVGEFELSSVDGELETDSGQAEGNLEFVSCIDNELKELLDFTQEEDIQDVQQEVHLEKPMEQLQTNLIYQR